MIALTNAARGRRLLEVWLNELQVFAEVFVETSVRARVVQVRDIATTCACWCLVVAHQVHHVYK